MEAKCTMQFLAPDFSLLAPRSSLLLSPADTYSPQPTPAKPFRALIISPVFSRTASGTFNKKTGGTYENH
jgi:hypothetical protein